MSKAYSLLMLGLILITSISADAKIFRVGYNGIQLVGVDYNDITAANNAANPGDTIQIYGTQTGMVNKKLIILGFGFNFDVHQNLQIIGTDAPSGVSMSFQPGSEGSIIEGCTLSYTHPYYGLTLETSNITIRRCIGRILLYNADRSINNIKVIGSVINQVSGMYQNNGNSCTSFQMFNCIVQGTLSFYGSGTNGALINCVIGHPWISAVTNFTNAGFLVKNSIVQNMRGDEINTVWENNFFAQSQPSVLPQGSNNQWGQAFSSIFERLGGNLDNYGYVNDGTFDEAFFQLKSSSPAIKGGFDGNNNPTDCGIFGGEQAYHYKLSGVPAVPAIYKITPASGAATTNPYNVTISVRSNN